ncbi:MAG: VOC family protein [Candidatus Uhrbacteria bacterium]
MTFKNIDDFFLASQSYINQFNTWVEQTKPSARADHLCYKCSDAVEFEFLRSLFETVSCFIYQSIISNRRIAIIKFQKPLETVLGEVWFLELSDQKTDGSQTSGFDHLEIYPSSGSVEQLVKQLASQKVLLEKIVRPHHTTYDVNIAGSFKVRIEAESLVDKIKKTEMVFNLSS